MCIAAPGQVLGIEMEAGLKMGRIDYAGIICKACLEYVPDVQIGQYVIVHAGFAISIIDHEEALKTLALWNEYAAHREQQGKHPSDIDERDEPLDLETSETRGER